VLTKSCRVEGEALRKPVGNAVAGVRVVSSGPATGEAGVRWRIQGVSGADSGRVDWV
jgi:hypothetical protein